MTSLSARERRLVAVFILLLLVALVYRLVVAPFIDGFTERSERRAQLAQMFVHNQHLIDSVPVLRRKAEAQRADFGRFALGAPSISVAQDRLKQRLGDRLAAAGGQLRSMDEINAGAGWVGVSMQCDLTLPQLVSLLQDLQNQPPYLVVTGLTIVADRAFQSGKLDVMDVRIDIAIPYTRAA